MSNPAYILKGQQLRIAALKLIWRFGWLRPQELGLLLWPNSKSAATQGRNFGKKIIDESLVITRTLPFGMGTALVLSPNGVRLLSDDIQHDTPKKERAFGKMIDGKFIHPHDLIHDLNAITFLIALKYKYKDAKIWSEREIKRNYKNADLLGKIQDGMFTVNGKTYLLEGERTGKRGKELENMIINSDKIFDGRCKNIFNKNPSDVIFLVLSDTHIASILRKFAELKDNPANETSYTLKHGYRITFAIPIFDGFAVRDFTIERYSINGPLIHHEMMDTKKLLIKIQELRRQNLMPEDRRVPFFRFPDGYPKL
jgi:hypothetical protein